MAKTKKISIMAIILSILIFNYAGGIRIAKQTQIARNSTITGNTSFDETTFFNFETEKGAIKKTSANWSDEPLWALKKIAAPQAWAITTGETKIQIGIVDSGIDLSNPDLTTKVNMSISKCFECGKIGGCDTIAKGHGTLVAGVIAADNSNALGATGVAPNVTLVDLKRAHQGPSSLGNIIKAIEYAELMGIQILNLSCGCYGISTSQMEALNNAIINYDGIIVCSAGNEGKNTDIISHYPGNLDFGSIINVGACYYTDEKLTTSNFGKETVDLFAPGSSITTTAWCAEPCTSNHEHANGYCTTISGGTSIATPFVSGVAALIWSANPDLSACEVKDTILKNVDKIDALNGLCVSDGRLNAYKALTNIQRHHYENFNTGKIAGHTRVCYDCGYTAVIDHRFDQVKAIYATGIVGTCMDCGFSIQDNYHQMKDMVLSISVIYDSIYFKTLSGIYVDMRRKTAFWNKFRVC